MLGRVVVTACAEKVDLPRAADACQLCAFDDAEVCAASVFAAGMIAGIALREGESGLMPTLCPSCRNALVDTAGANGLELAWYGPTAGDG